MVLGGDSGFLLYALGLPVSLRHELLIKDSVVVTFNRSILEYSCLFLDVILRVIYLLFIVKWELTDSLMNRAKCLKRGRSFPYFP